MIPNPLKMTSCLRVPKPLQQVSKISTILFKLKKYSVHVCIQIFKKKTEIIILNCSKTHSQTPNSISSKHFIAAYLNVQAVTCSIKGQI